MANNFDISNAAASAAADAVTALVNGGTLRIYSGTKPAGPDSALSGNTVLAELTFGNPAFGSATNGVATANSITADSSANATGTASFFRAFASNGTTAVFDGEVGTSGSDLNLNSTSIQSGAEVSITSFTYTQPKG